MNDRKKIIRCFWIFLFFLLTEGIFRRWLLPGLNNVFLVIRDPFVLFAVVLGLRQKLLQHPIPIFIMAVGIVCFVCALLLGHGNILVAIYGARITVLYFPFIYICSRVLSRKDVLKVGKILVLMIIPMVVLNIIQFYSPQSSFVNIGVGGDEEGAGFNGAMGYFRPPGIFSFIAGLTDYYAAAVGFLLYFFICPEEAEKVGLSRRLILLSIVAYLLSIPVTISRTHFVQTLYVCAFFLVIAVRQKKMMQRILIGVSAIILAMPLLMMNSSVQLFVDVFMSRFSDANSVEGGMAQSAYERLFGWLFRAMEKAPFFGFGDGYFSNFGMKLIKGSATNYQGDIAVVADATEMEWGRIVCEDGIILGIMLILGRLAIAWTIFKKALIAFRRRKDYLSWLLMPMAVFSVAIYQCKASYNLGFMSLMVIVALTSLRTGKNNIHSHEHTYFPFGR